MANYNIFISYSRENTDFARHLYQELLYACLRPYLDAECSTETANLAEASQVAIEDADDFIFVYGRLSEESIYQRRELDLAIEYKKRVHTILLCPATDGVVCSILQRHTKIYSNIPHLLHSLSAKQSEAEVCYKRLPIEQQHCVDKHYESRNKSKRGRRTVWIILIALLVGAAQLLFQLLLLSPLYNDEFYDDYYCDYYYDCSGSEEYYDYDYAPPSDMSSTETVYNNIDSLYDFESQYETIHDPEPKLEEVFAPPYYNRPLFFTLALAAIIFLILIAWVLTRLCRRKKNIKLSSDIDTTISIDSRHIATIKAGEVHSLHLSKGEYLVEFRAKERANDYNRTVLNVTDSNSRVLLSEFNNKREVKFRCFIAGSIKLSSQRDALRSTLAQMYNKWEESNIRISSHTFEDFSRDVVPEGQQKLYNEFILNDAKWVVIIADENVGAETLKEYRIAMDSCIKNGHPKILFLANNQTQTNGILSDIKQEIVKTEQYWNTYNNNEHMKFILYQCIDWDINLLSKKLSR